MVQTLYAALTYLYQVCLRKLIKMGRKHRKCIICNKNEYSISFFAAFPIDEERCRKWVKVIGNEDLIHVPIEKLNQLRFVCGDHFAKKLFTKAGKKLRKGAVPSLNIEATPLTDEQLIQFPQHVSNYQCSKGMRAELRKYKNLAKNLPETVMVTSDLKSDINELSDDDYEASFYEKVEEERRIENSQICRTCLVTNVKMYDMQTLHKLTEYLELIGISNFGVYSHICYICVARLRKCERFRSSCLKADETLKKNVTEGVLRRYRKQKGLVSLQKSSTIIVDLLYQSQNEASIEKTHVEHTPIKIEPNSESYSVQNVIKTECDNSQAGSDIENNDVSSVCDLETLQPFDNSAEIKDINDDEATSQSQGNNSEVKGENIDIKTKVTTKRNIPAVDIYFSDDDDKPLSKLPKTKKKRITKPRAKKDPNVNNRIKFDPKAFEEYAAVFLLTPEDAKKEVELRKESSNYKDCQFKCNMCYRGYESQNTFDNHMKKHKVSYGAYECEFCRLRFPKRHERGKHLMSCHRRKFVCHLCPFICYSIARAKIHMSLHKGVKYTCDQCGQNFRMPNTLLRHKRDKHSKQCVCGICGSTFVNEKGLHAHNKLIHKQDVNDKKGPQCAECDVHFATELAWKRHLVLSSKHEVNNGCETCGETFDSEESLKRHTRVHARKRPRADDVPLPAACTICTKWLTSRPEFKQHMTTQHPGSALAQRIEDECPYVCEFCGKRFQFRVHMFIHQRMHTGERPYRCDVCDRRFAFPASLTAHVKTHSTTRKLLKCTMCDKVFKTKFAHTKHVKLIHLNIRPHSCDVCGKSYHNLCEVKYHKQHVHGNVPWPKRDRSKRNKIFEEQSGYME